MKLSIEALAIILLAIPVALFVIWNLPGLGIVAALVLIALPFFIRQQRHGDGKHHPLAH